MKRQVLKVAIFSREVCLCPCPEVIFFLQWLQVKRHQIQTVSPFAKIEYLAEVKSVSSSFKYIAYSA